MGIDDISLKVLIISDLFERYTILVLPSNNSTSVYCEECEVWVNRYEGDLISNNNEEEFYEMIISDHSHQVSGRPFDVSNGIDIV